MILLDVKILMYAFRDDSAEHPAYARYLNDLANSGDMFGVPETCLVSVIRISTQMKPASSTKSALGFCDAIRNIPTCSVIHPSNRHWEVFSRLAERISARGKLLADVYLAAFAIDRGDEWVTADGDFAKFPGLRWRHPLRGRTITNPS